MILCTENHSYRHFKKFHDTNHETSIFLFFAFSSESQYICDCLQESETGVTLLRPHPPPPMETMGRSIASEIHFTPGNNGTCEFLFKKITVVSESRHLELYIDDIYEMTSKGCAVTLKKGRYVGLIEYLALGKQYGESI